MILGTIEVLAEAHTLAEKSGIGSDAVHDLVKGKSTASVHDTTHDPLPRTLPCSKVCLHPLTCSQKLQ